jgi:hypothetical protein
LIGTVSAINLPVTKLREDTVDDRAHDGGPQHVPSERFKDGIVDPIDRENEVVAKRSRPASTTWRGPAHRAGGNRDQANQVPAASRQLSAAHR